MKASIVKHCGIELVEQKRKNVFTESEYSMTNVEQLKEYLGVLKEDEWTALANLSEKDLAEFEIAFSAIQKLQPPMKKAVQAIIKCCADVAGLFCEKGAQREVVIQGKFYNEVYRFLANLIQEMKADFDQQIEEQTKEQG